MRRKTFFQRKHDKKVDLKGIERSTVSTLLIPKHLVEKLDLVLPVLRDTATMKKSYNWKAGLKKLLEKYRGFFAAGHYPFKRSQNSRIRKRGWSYRDFLFARMMRIGLSLGF